MIYPTQAQLDLFKRTPGAISVHEMIAIMNVVAEATGGGAYAEMGSHRGKSGVAAAIGMKHAGRPDGSGNGMRLYMVDPLYDMTNLEAWKHACQGHPDNAWQGAKEPDFRATVERVIDEASDDYVAPHLMGDFSTHAIPEIGHHFSYVLLDADQHTYELTTEELGLLRKRMIVGGVIGFHDFMSQYTGVERAYREMLTGRGDGIEYHEVPIDWPEIKRWVAANGGEKGNDSWHHNTEEAPCFFGALKRVK
jgi:hypothetical protein